MDDRERLKIASLVAGQILSQTVTENNLVLDNDIRQFDRYWEKHVNGAARLALLIVDRTEGWING